MIDNFTQSYLSVFLKLRNVDKESFLNIILIDENEPSTLFWLHGRIMTKLVIVNTHYFEFINIES